MASLTIEVIELTQQTMKKQLAIERKKYIKTVMLDRCFSVCQI